MVQVFIKQVNRSTGFSNPLVELVFFLHSIGIGETELSELWSDRTVEQKRYECLLLYHLNQVLDHHVKRAG